MCLYCVTVRVHDLIQEVNGNRVLCGADFHSLAGAVKPGDVVALAVVRSGVYHTAMCTSRAPGYTDEQLEALRRLDLLKEEDFLVSFVPHASGKAAVLQVTDLT